MGYYLVVMGHNHMSHSDDHLPFLAFHKFLFVIIAVEIFNTSFSYLWSAAQLKKDNMYFARLAYDAIKEGNLENLKKHPLWDLESPSCDRAQFV